MRGSAIAVIVSLGGAAMLSGFAGAQTPARAVRTPVPAPASQGGACSAVMPDGRSLITGGSGSAGALATAAYFESTGQLTAVATMISQRAGHVCVALKDGTLLVGGGDASSGPGAGETGNGATNSAEIYRPSAKSWAPTGAMVAPRKGASAILLKDGTVLVAGGEAYGKPADTLEVYDPASGRFGTVPGVLSTPGAGHAIAALDDGRVLIAGGMQNGVASDAIDIFDPAQNRIVPGGHMSVGRAQFTATPLAGGKVLLAGGTDGQKALASAEAYDPSTQSTELTAPMQTARQGQLAVRMPGSDQVLVASGAGRGRTPDTAECYNPAKNAFEPAQEADGANAPAASLTVGFLAPDGSVRAQKRFRATAAPANQNQ